MKMTGLTWDQKMEIAKEAISEGTTRKEVAKKYGVPITSVNYWVSCYRRDNVLHIESEDTLRDEQEKQLNEIESLRAQVKELTSINAQLEDTITTYAIRIGELNAELEVANQGQHVKDLRELSINLKKKIETYRNFIKHLLDEI